MAKQRTMLRAGPAFYEVWAGAMKAQGLSVQDFASARGIQPSNLKVMATGASNGPKSKRIREEMVQTVGEDVFRTLYELRLRNEEAH